MFELKLPAYLPVKGVDRYPGEALDVSALIAPVINVLMTAYFNASVVYSEYSAVFELNLPTYLPSSSSP